MVVSQTLSQKENWGTSLFLVGMNLNRNSICCGPRRNLWSMSINDKMLHAMSEVFSSCLFWRNFITQRRRRDLLEPSRQWTSNWPLDACKYQTSTTNLNRVFDEVIQVIMVITWLQNEIIFSKHDNTITSFLILTLNDSEWFFLGNDTNQILLTWTLKKILWF